MNRKNATIGVVIPTLNAEHHLVKCLTPLLNSSLKPHILVIDSSSTDRTVEIAKGLGVEVLVIPREEFNHGLTREKARRHLRTDVIVMLTEDAYAQNEHLIAFLTKPILEGRAAIAYGRQIPHKGASFFESFPRRFNYPSKSHIRTLADIGQYGVYTFFCSDSCAAYSNAALDSIGGFPKVLIGEDTVVTAKLLHKGHSVAYVAEAVVHHSHDYTLIQEFRRYFDTGLARKEYAALLRCESTDSKRGASFFKEMLLALCKEAPLLIPYAFLQTACKWLGYKLGQLSTHAPLWIKKSLSGQKYFWVNQP